MQTEVKSTFEVPQESLVLATQLSSFSVLLVTTYRLTCVLSYNSTVFCYSQLLLDL